MSAGILPFRPAAPAAGPVPGGVIGRVCRHELRVLARDRSLLVALLLLAGLAAYGLANGRAWTAFQSRTLQAAVDSSTARRAALVRSAETLDPTVPPASPFAPSPFNPWSVANTLGVQVAALPPGPLAALATGQSDLLPYYFTVSARSRQAVFGGSDEIENPGNLLAGRFDLAFVLVFLFPLVILALSYNMLAGEREDGTLRLLLAQPVRLREVVLGKVLARALVVAAVSVVMVGAGVAAGGGAPAGLVLAWLAAVLLYAAVWFGLAIWVNARGGTAAGHAVQLAAIWLGLAVIVPSLVNAAATTWYPAPSRVGLVTAMREASNAANARGAALLAKYYTDHPELAPDSARVDLNDFMARNATVQDEVERTLAPLYDAFDAQLDAQQRLVRRAGLVSPAIVANDLLSALAGTGLDRYTAFRDQVRAFHAQWQAALLPRVLRRERLTPADVRALPLFAFRDPEPAEVLRGALPALGWLALTAAGIWALGFRALRQARALA